MLFNRVGYLYIPFLSYLARYIHPNLLTFIGICLLTGACAKSTQNFLFNKLPSSM